MCFLVDRIVDFWVQQQSVLLFGCGGTGLQVLEHVAQAGKYITLCPPVGLVGPPTVHVCALCTVKTKKIRCRVQSGIDSFSATSVASSAVKFWVRMYATNSGSAVAMFSIFGVANFEGAQHGGRGGRR